MPTRTSKADRNLLSCSGNVWQLYAGTPDAQPADLSAITLLTPDNPRDWDTLLKVCDLTTALKLLRLRVAQGQENAIDCNNGVTNCSFDGEIGLGGGTGDNVITVKGGCDGLVFRGMIWSRGRIATATVGNWSDQSHAISRNLDFSGLTHASGAPLTFVLARCDRKTVVLPPGAKVLFWRSLGLSAYWWAKWAAVKLGFFR